MDTNNPQDVLQQLGNAREALRREIRAINQIPSHLRTDADKRAYRLSMKLLREVNARIKAQQMRLF